MRHKYTKEQVEYIKANMTGIGNKELTDKVNEKFGLALRITQLKAFKGNHKLNSGLDGRFPKGHVPWCKGLKGVTTGGVSTQFKKGSRPKNYMPVGSERINSYGYADVKIADPDRWKGKHKILWEEHNGPIPEGKVLIFADRDKSNIQLSNLVLVSRQELLYLNRHGLINKNDEITHVGVLMAGIDQRIHSMKTRESDS